MTYTVYGARGSTNFAVEAALTIAGMDYDYVQVDLASNAQRDEAYAKINPTRKIPAMRLPSGEIVTESVAILLTIADRYPKKNLLPPSGSADRAQAYRWLAFFASEIYPMVEIEDYPERFAGKKGNPDEIKEIALARVRDRFLIFEHAIAGPWILPSGFCIADLYAVNMTRWSVGTEWREKNCPKIQKHAAAVAARPDVAPVFQKHFGNRK